MIHWIHFPQCQLPSVEKFRVVRRMIGGVGVGATLRVSSWLSAWARHDSPHSHLHLGPIGVAPAAQGRHIGHQLMEKYCEELDRTGSRGYLETDRPENVRFYRRFGFEATGEIVIFGVPSYFMSRKAS